ncbi:MAG: YoaK family protein [Planctomycetota bacterium]
MRVDLITPPAVILQSRLAISLAAIAGHVNIVALLTCGVVTSHMTGHAGALGRDAAAGDGRATFFMAVLLGAFLFGAFLSGLAVEFGRMRGWRAIYALPAAIELALLAAFAIGVDLHDPSQTETGAGLWWMSAVAVVAMGAQNATVTRISSGIVRTTHLTGILTDLGHESAQILLLRGPEGRPRRQPGVGGRRIALLALIAGAFILGSAVGALCFAHQPKLSMIPPVVLLAFIIVQDFRTPMSEVERALGAHGGR